VIARRPPLRSPRLVRDLPVGAGRAPRAIAAIAAAALAASCQPPPPAMLGASHRSPAAKAPPAAAPAPVDPAKELTLIPQEQPPGVPDAWDPAGRRAGLTAPCRVWETEGWRYRGAVDESVCGAWKAAAEKARGGRTAAIAGADVVVSQEGGASTALHEECKPKACAAVAIIGLSPSGDELAAIRAGKSELLVWNVKAGAIAARLPFRKPTWPITAGQIVWSGDGTIVVVTSADYEMAAFAWDPAARAAASPPRDLETGGRGSLSVDPWGRFIVKVTSRKPPRKGEPGSSEIVAGSIKPLSKASSATELTWESRARGKMGSAYGAPAPVIAAWQPDGSQVLWATPASSGDTDVALLRVDAASFTTAKGPSPTAAALGVDGARAALARDGTLAMWSVAERKVEFDEQLPSGRVSRVAFSADAKHVSVIYDDHLEVRGVERRGVELFWAGVASASWSPRDAVLAATVPSGRVQVRDVASRSMLFETNEGASVVDGSFSPDGSRLVTAAVGKIVVWNADAWKAEQEIPVGGVSDVLWSPRGDALAIVAGTKIVMWDIGRDAARATLTLPSAAVRAVWPRGAGGKAGAELIVLSAAGDVTTYDIARGNAVRTTAKMGVTPADAAAIGPDGAVAISGPRSVRRLRDGAELTLTAASVIADGGAFDGDEAVLAPRVYRLGPDPLDGRLVPAVELADQLRHPGLLRDFLAGKPIDPPHLRASSIR